MPGKTKINQAHWFGDTVITSVAGMEKEFPANIDTLFLEFGAITGVHHYVLTVNDGAFQGTGAWLAGTKKMTPGRPLTINHYGIKKIKVTAHDASGAALAIGEVGYMGFMTDKAIESYLVVGP